MASCPPVPRPLACRRGLGQPLEATCRVHPARWTGAPPHVDRSPLRVCIKDQDTQPDEAFPDDPTPLHRQHEMTRRPARILVLLRQPVAQGAVEPGEGTLPGP